MTCPECSGELCVDRTIKTTKMDVRHRRCLGCGVRWESTETLTKGSRKGAANSSPVAVPAHSQPPPVALPALSGRIPSAKGVGGSVSGISDRQGDQGDTDHQTEVQATASAGATPAQAILRAVPLPPAEKPAKKSAAPSPAFLAFWKAFPPRRKCDAKGALRAWHKEAGDHLLPVILAALEWQKPMWAAKDDGEYTPGPAPYLNKRMWEMHRPKAAAASGAPAMTPEEETRIVAERRKDNGVSAAELAEAFPWMAKS